MKTFKLLVCAAGEEQREVCVEIKLGRIVFTISNHPFRCSEPITREVLSFPLFIHKIKEKSHEFKY